MIPQVVSLLEWHGPPKIFRAVTTSSYGQARIAPITVVERPQEVIRLPDVDRAATDPYAGLTKLDDLIAELRATDTGRRVYERANREWEQKAMELISRGRLSRLRYRRIKAGLTQEILAELTGIRQPNLQRLERPSYRGGLVTYQRLAKALNCDYRELLP